MTTKDFNKPVHTYQHTSRYPVYTNANIIIITVFPSLFDSWPECHCQGFFIIPLLCENIYGEEVTSDFRIWRQPHCNDVIIIITESARLHRHLYSSCQPSQTFHDVLSQGQFPNRHTAETYSDKSSPTTIQIVYYQFSRSKILIIKYVS